MSMLAGPRRKQKVINLRAKNNAWSNDSSKFGQRMLEKMGWSEGKGLGAKENGIVEHVVARYKNDEKGLGFEDKNDQWTKHEDDFNALLANLSNGSNNDEKIHSGVSLEVKSKKSKARVHYHKFTRGKDLTRYSEKDLANIFGKKSLKNKDNIEEPILREEEKNTENVFTEKGSMQDYFASKLVNFKSKSKNITHIDNKDVNDYVFKGFSNTQNSITESGDDKNCDFQPFSFYGNTITEMGNVETKQNSENLEKKKRKKKMSKYQGLGSETNGAYTEEETSINNCNKEEELETLEKTKKKKKNKELALHEEITPAINHNDDYVPKKKKKRKNKDA